MRNGIVHGCWSVDLDVLLATAHDDLPTSFLGAVRAIAIWDLPDEAALRPHDGHRHAVGRRVAATIDANASSKTGVDPISLGTRGHARGRRTKWTTMRCEIEPGGWHANRVAVWSVVWWIMRAANGSVISL